MPKKIQPGDRVTLATEDGLIVAYVEAVIHYRHGLKKYKIEYWVDGVKQSPVVPRKLLKRGKWTKENMGFKTQGGE